MKENALFFVEVAIILPNWNLATVTASPTPSATELVGLLTDRKSFESTVKALRDAGFARTDLSVLSTHDSIDTVGSPGKPLKDTLTALVGELKFEGPLVASGAIYLAGGPMAGTIAALIGAAVGTVAAKEVIEEVTSTPDTEDFTRAVEAGSIILWVRIEDDAAQAKAEAILAANGAENVHVHKPA